jgi:hypothetical protein
MRSIAAVLLLSTCALADVTLRMGDGINYGEIVEASYNHKIAGPLGLQTTLGFTRPPRSPFYKTLINPHLSLSPFLELCPGHSFLKFSHGIAVISSTNPWLTTHFQFQTTLELGLAQDGYKLGLFITHFSNGNIRLPNPGANFVGVAFSMPLW